jgi:hypothetical protein
MRWVALCGAAAVLALAMIGPLWAQKPDQAAATTKQDLEALLARLDEIAQDQQMTTAQKAVLSGTEMDKFNQQHKGKLLELRLKVQDVVPFGQGHYVTANVPDLDRVQFPTSKFHMKLAPSEVMGVGKDNSLLLRGLLAGVMQPRTRLNPLVVEPGNSFSFPLRSNYLYRVCLEGVSFQLTAAKAEERPVPAPTPGFSPGNSAATYKASGYGSSGYASSGYGATARSSSGGTSGGYHSAAGGLSSGGDFGRGSLAADKGGPVSSHHVDEIKAYFLKGISTPRGTTRRDGSPSYDRPNDARTTKNTATTSRTKHNHVYMAGDLIRKFGQPTARKSTMSSETWVYKCPDGVVTARFNLLGYGPASRGGAVADRLRLEITSVDATSGSTMGLR